MNSQQIKARDNAESAWKRAWSDACAFFRTPFFYVTELIFASASVISAVVLTDQTPFARISVPVIALIVPPAITFVIAVCRSPIAQRNEARSEVLLLWAKLEPKLTIVEAEVKVNLIEHGQVLISEMVLLRIRNESAATVERCTGHLIDVKPRVEWLDFVEGDRAIGQSIGFPTEIPLPMPLVWFAQESKSEDSSLRVPPDGEALLELCHYYQDRGDRRDLFTLAFQSKEMRGQHHLPVTEIVLSVCINSDLCPPLYCVCTYCPEMPAVDYGVRCQVMYRGPNRPNLDAYRIFKQTPRPRERGDSPSESTGV